jgi:hypothetical protein
MSPKAICRPAKTLASVDCAATPATIPMMPAEASSEAPMVRIAGKVSSIAATATTPTVTDTTRWISVTCVRTRRTRAASCVADAKRAYEASTTAAATRTASHAQAAIRKRTRACPTAARWSRAMCA